MMTATMTRMITKEDQKMNVKMQEMLEGQENRLGSEIRRMFGENPPIVGHKAS